LKRLGHFERQAASGISGYRPAKKSRENFLHPDFPGIAIHRQNRVHGCEFIVQPSVCEVFRGREELIAPVDVL
jgi:hypothetical protein